MDRAVASVLQVHALETWSSFCTPMLLQEMLPVQDRHVGHCLPTQL